MTAPIRLVQFAHPNGTPAVGLVDGDAIRPVAAAAGTFDLASQAISEGGSIAEVVEDRLIDDVVSYDLLLAEHRVRPPIYHPCAPGHFLLSGTGLTHIQSAAVRESMHERQDDEEAPSDPMRLYQQGLSDGKPEPGRIGAMPEWFYKGDGGCVVAPGMSFTSPNFCGSCAEEPEIVGLYIVGPDGTPWRVGFTMGNDLSDHATERLNFMYIAPSKLRQCALGPELLIGALPERVDGVSRIRRDGVIAWEGVFQSGEANMSYSIANLEHHHFRYPFFRRPGDLHAHFFGAAVMSVSDGFETRDGDVFDFDVPAFGRPLVNPLRFEPGKPSVFSVKAL